MYDSIRNTGHHRYNGFTLIELMVVISIISLLVSILLPALSTARRQAKSIQCASQVKQIGVAMHLYLHDYDGYFPPTYDSVTKFGGKVPTSGPTWAEYFAAKYLQGKKLLECPESPSGWSAAAGYYVQYGLNRYLQGTGVSQKQRIFSIIERIKQQSSTIMLTDSCYSSYLSPVAGFYVVQDAYRVHLRHSQGANVLYVDGHSSLIATDNPTAMADPNNPLYVSNFYREP